MFLLVLVAAPVCRSDDDLQGMRSLCWSTAGAQSQVFTEKRGQHRLFLNVNVMAFSVQLVFEKSSRRGLTFRASLNNRITHFSACYLDLFVCLPLQRRIREPFLVCVGGLFELELASSFSNTHTLLFLQEKPLISHPSTFLLSVRPKTSRLNILKMLILKSTHCAPFTSIFPCFQ